MLTTKMMSRASWRGSSRLLPILRKSFAKTFCSSSTIPKETLASSSLNEPPAKKFPFFLKFALFGSLTGAAAAVGYTTYAYSTEEVDEKSKLLRASVNSVVGDDASAFDKFRSLFYSTSTIVAVKTIDHYLDLRRSIEEQVRDFAEPLAEKLLPDLAPNEQHVFTLVLDLNETLLYSDWKRERGWRTFKRPGVDDFLAHMAKFYEIVVYTDEQSGFVDPVLQRLDPSGYIRYKLYRPATKYQDGKHFRDLSKLNRDSSRIIYVSGHALESTLQQENCVQIKPWKLEADDTQLLDLIPFLEYVGLHRPADIRPVLASYQGQDVATEFINRSREHQRWILEQRKRGRLNLR